MANKAPASKIESLVNDIVDLSRGKSFNEVRLKGIENQVNKLMDDDPAHANLALGMLQALRGNKDQAHRHHKIACDLAPGDVVCIKNWAISCYNLEDLDMAVQIIRKAVRLEPADLSAKADLLGYLAQSGRYIEASTLLNGYREKGMASQPMKVVDDNLLQHIDFVSAEMAMREITDEDMSLFKNVIRSVLGLDGARRYNVWSDEDTINFEFLCNATVDKTFELKTMLIDKLAKMDVEVTSRFALVAFTVTPTG